MEIRRQGSLNMNKNLGKLKLGDKLRCGCIEGYQLCSIAEKLWRLHIAEYNSRNYKKSDYYRRKYDKHFNGAIKC